MIGFHDFYQHHAQDVYRFSFWLSGDATEADEITSETFVRVWTAFDKVQMETAKGYLFKIARNLFLQRQRRSRRYMKLDAHFPDPAPDPSEIVGEQEELQIVLKALQTLPEIDRAALLMRAQDGLSYTEIALALRISVSSAKVKVHRSRLKLLVLRSPKGEKLS